MAKRKPALAGVVLYPETPIPDGEMRGADDRPISRGQVVRRVPYFSEKMGVTVPTLVGRVMEIARVNHSGRVVVHVALAGESGRATFPVERIRRSQARMEP